MHHTEEQAMQIVLTENDMGRLSPAARAEIINCLNPPQVTGGEPNQIPSDAPLAEDAEYRDIDMSNVVDLTPSQVREWMEAASDKTKHGLRIFAEQGPVIRRQGIDGRRNPKLLPFPVKDDHPHTDRHGPKRLPTSLVGTIGMWPKKAMGAMR